MRWDRQWNIAGTQSSDVWHNQHFVYVKMQCRRAAWNDDLWVTINIWILLGTSINHTICFSSDPHFVVRNYTSAFLYYIITICLQLANGSQPFGEQSYFRSAMITVTVQRAMSTVLCELPPQITLCFESIKINSKNRSKSIRAYGNSPSCKFNVVNLHDFTPLHFTNRSTHLRLRFATVANEKCVCYCYFNWIIQLQLIRAIYFVSLMTNIDVDKIRIIYFI